jgi:hypothetical protein
MDLEKMVGVKVGGWVEVKDGVGHGVSLGVTVGEGDDAAEVGVEHPEIIKRPTTRRKKDCFMDMLTIIQTI